MQKKLTRTGNSLAVILDRALLEQTGIDEQTPLEISTDGDVIVMTPMRTEKRARKLDQSMKEVNERYAGVFRKLAR